jgi:hypothetical protein
MNHSRGDDIPSCNIRIDKEGRWFYQEAEIIRQDIVRHFYAHLESDGQGRVIIHLRGERCVVEAEDVPFVVLSITNVPSSRNGESIKLLLNDGSLEELDPYTLFIGEGNVPYCQVRGGVFMARFSRNAYYQLAKYFEEDQTTKDRYYISLQGKRHYLKMKTLT